MIVFFHPEIIFTKSLRNQGCCCSQSEWASQLQLQLQLRAPLLQLRAPLLQLQLSAPAQGATAPASPGAAPLLFS